MQSFEDFLREGEALYPARTAKSAQAIISRHVAANTFAISNAIGLDRFAFAEDGTVSVPNSRGPRTSHGKIIEIGAAMRHGGRLIVKFGHLQDVIFRVENVGSGQLIDCAGFPPFVSGEVSATWAIVMTGRQPDRWDGFTRKLAGSLDMTTLNLRSLTGLDKNLHSCYRIGLPKRYVGPMLGLLNINTLSHIISSAAADEEPRTASACDIVNQHLAKGRDILACQEELIDNDLEEFAEL